MADPISHLIHRLSVLVNADSREKAQETGDRISRLVHSRMLQIMEKVFSEVDIPDQIIRIDRLEIDLGFTPEEQLESKLEQMLPALLKEKLLELFSPDRRTGSPDIRPGQFSSPSFFSLAQGKKEALFFFLRTGRMPNWISGDEEDAMVTLFRELLGSPPQSWRKDLEEVLSDQPALQRMVFQMPRDLVQQFYDASSPAFQEKITSIREIQIGDSERRQTVSPWQKEEKIKRQRQIQLLQHLALFNRLPWWTPELTSADTEVFFLELLELYPARLRKSLTDLFLSQISEERRKTAIANLVRHWSDISVRQLVALLGKEQPPQAEKRGSMVKRIQLELEKAARLANRSMSKDTPIGIEPPSENLAATTEPPAPVDDGKSYDWPEKEKSADISAAQENAGYPQVPPPGQKKKQEAEEEKNDMARKRPEFPKPAKRPSRELEPPSAENPWSLIEYFLTFGALPAFFPGGKKRLEEILQDCTEKDPGRMIRLIRSVPVATLLKNTGLGLLSVSIQDQLARVLLSGQAGSFLWVYHRIRKAVKKKATFVLPAIGEELIRRHFWVYLRQTQEGRFSTVSYLRHLMKFLVREMQVNALQIIRSLQDLAGPELTTEKEKREIMAAMQVIEKNIESLPQLKKPLLTEDPPHPQPVRPLPEGEAVFVKNAGLVLLWPFFSSYFQRIDLLTPERMFRDQAAAHRAAHLLQYLAAKQEQTPEHHLILNKLLCGIPLEEPLEMDVRITEKEKAVSESLLQAVIQQWAVLKNTSPDGLRGSFFVREGRLIREKDQKWVLRVEQKAFDLLLDRLPWSYKMIKLSWAPHVLYVEWR